MGVASSSGNAAGVPVVDAATCNACGLCVDVCATGTLVERGERIEVVDSSFGCIGCAHCALVCPHGSVTVTGRNTRPEDLVPLPPGRATPESLDALFLARRSVRRFRADPVPRDLIERVVAAAATAPMGIPPWEVGVTVYHGRDKVAALASDVADVYAYMVKYADNAAVRTLVLPFVGRTRRETWEGFLLPLAREVTHGKERGRDELLHGAPAALVFHHSAFADKSDAVIACTYAMLAAEALGLGSTMIGALCPPMAGRKDLLRRHGIPAGQTPAIALILGWPRARYQRGIRRPFKSVDWV